MWSVIVIVLVMLLVLGVAGLVIFYVAYPHRGETPPAQLQGLHDAMGRAAGGLPTLDAEEQDRARGRAPDDGAADGPGLLRD